MPIMTIYESLVIMISFATLIVMITKHDDHK
ncbi:hypothetical protein JOE23_003227 [Amphibacillus cookii]|nr:hypothetical protein [Amphibacillus cookii]